MFLPLCEEEIGNVDVPQRMINYIDLLNSICYRLPDAMGIQPGGPTAQYRPYKSILHRPLLQDGRNIGLAVYPVACVARIGRYDTIVVVDGPGFYPRGGGI